MEADIYLVYSTCGNIGDAKRIARSLVEDRLVACVNIIPVVHSVYWWKGNIEEENEIAILAKTTKDRIKEVISKIKELHTYELPDIIAIPVVKGYKKFLQYIRDETS